MSTKNVNRSDYKPTEVGWTDCTLGDLFERRVEKGMDGLVTLSVTLHDGLVERSELERKNETNLAPEQHLLVRKGDIAYNMMRMWQGASGLAEIDGITSPAYIVLQPKQGIDTRFAAQWFKSHEIINLFRLYSHGLTKDRLRLYFDDFAQIPVTVPSLAEQRRIAEILSTWDRAIDQTHRLLDACKRRKQALMQNLLTGAWRFPEHKDTWKSCTLKDILQVKHGKSQKQVACANGKNPILATGGEIGRTDFYLYDKPSVLIGRKGTIDAPQYCDIPFWTIDTLFYTEICHSYYPKYVYFLFLTIPWYSYNESTGVPSLNASTIEGITVCIPPLPEQEKIASILSTVDEEITALQKSLEKLQLQKRGLMQKLLTGTVRV